MRLRSRLALVVDAGVEAEGPGHPGAFLRPAGDADRPAAEIVRDLADEHADGAGRGGHQHRLAFLRPADMDQPVIGRLAGDAVERDQVAERAHIRRQLLQAARLVHGIILPAERAAHDVAGRKPVRRARAHDADAVAVHDVAGADPLAVGVALHPGPVRGVERQQDRPDLHLTVLRFRKFPRTASRNGFPATCRPAFRPERFGGSVRASGVSSGFDAARGSRRDALRPYPYTLLFSPPPFLLPRTERSDDPGARVARHGLALRPLRRAQGRLLGPGSGPGRHFGFSDIDSRGRARTIAGRELTGRAFSA